MIKALIPVVVAVWMMGPSIAAAQSAGTAPEGRPLIADGAWAGVLAAHPRVLGSRDHLRALAKAKPEMYQRIKSLDDLLAVGIVDAVEGAPDARVQPILAEAMRNIARGPTNEHQDTWIWMEQVALTCDLFHDRISPADRAKMVAWLNANLDSFTTDENAFHNSTLSKVFCYLRIAYATWGENPRAKEFRDHALVKLYEGKLLPVIRHFGSGGGYTECGWYTRGSLWHLVQGLELARRVEGYDGFKKAGPFFYERLGYELLQPYPGSGQYGAEHFATEGDGSNIYGGHVEYPRLTRTLLAQYYRGSEMSRYLAARQRKASNPQIAIMDFLYQEPADSPLPLSGAPLAHIARGIGRVYARSDWGDDATWFRFECGDYFTQHDHFEAGNFEIFRYAPLATESGEYADWTSPHVTNWCIRTIAHNCVLIYQPDEVWRNNRRPKNAPYANDGGQSNNPSVADTLEQWLREKSRHERGRIVSFINNPSFVYVAGDCTKAYAPSKVSAYVRQVVFLRPHTFVILDRVNSTRAEYEKSWLLHCRNEPKITGNLSEIEDGKGKLYSQTLLPEGAKIEKIEGYTYRGETYKATKHALNRAANLWRVEVRPGKAAQEDLFLHVLSTEAAPRATAEVAGGQVRVAGAGWRIALDLQGTGGTVAVGSDEQALKE